jgi:AcrR family transcriptional regulator
VPSRKAGKTHEEARDESRQAILDAGAAMLLESARRNPFAGMRVRELCERAGYSTGTFYARWPVAEAFYVELATHLLENVLAEDFKELSVVAAEAAELEGTDAIVRLATADLDVLLRNEHWDSVELLNVTWGRTTLSEPGGQGYREMDALTVDTYGVVLERMGREARPPLSPRHVGAVLQALVEGFGLRSKVDPDGITLPDAGDPSLYALAVASVLSTLTRPIDDPRSVSQVLDAEFPANRST